MDMISELPKDILRRILYFLTQEEAVRTSVLSKSWRDIGCTRPNLDFSYENFKGKKRDFISVMSSTLQRYCDRRVCVEEFHLRISLGDLFYDFDHESVSFLEKWIPLLTVTGMKKFCLFIHSEHSPGRVKLPPVVFGAESLQDLHVEGFSLDQKAIERIVFFKHLKSLCLEKVCIEDEIFEKIISNCVLIETLIVKGCIRLRTIKVNDLHYLKDFFFKVYSIIRGRELCTIEIHPPSLETIDISYGNLWFPKGAEYRNLKDLSLCEVESSLDHFSSCKFPSLEYLRISGWAGLKGSHIFIDAPKILEFEYAEDFVPSISFAPTSSEWDSDIYINFELLDVTSSWFLKLKELLKSLSQSEISLTINQSPMNYQYPMNDDDDDDDDDAGNEYGDDGDEDVDGDDGDGDAGNGDGDDGDGDGDGVGDGDDGDGDGDGVDDHHDDGEHIIHEIINLVRDNATCCGGDLEVALPVIFGFISFKWCALYLSSKKYRRLPQR